MTNEQQACMAGIDTALQCLQIVDIKYRIDEKNDNVHRGMKKLQALAVIRECKEVIEQVKTWMAGKLETDAEEAPETEAKPAKKARKRRE